MDDRRFDSLAKALAAGKSRRSVLKGLFGLGAAATVGSTLMEPGSEAARRPTPTPKPITCPGNQTWNGSACVCPGSAPNKCGPDCCTSTTSAPYPRPPGHSECCDNACCFGTCYGEELCCATNNQSGGEFPLPPTNKICDTVNGPECCILDDDCCIIDGCCATVCFGGSVGADNCCSPEDFCPGGSESEDICCIGNTTCCDGNTNANACVDLTLESNCCDDDDCDGPCTVCNLESHTCASTCEAGTTCCPTPGGIALCVLSDSCECDEFCGPVETGENEGLFYCCTEPDYTICCDGPESECCGGPAGRQCQANGHCCEAATPFYCPGSGSTEPVCCATPCNPRDGTCTPSDACETTENCERCEVCQTGLCEPCESVGLQCCTDGVCRETCAAPCEPNCFCGDGVVDPATDGLDCNGGIEAGGGICACGWCVVPLDGCPCGCAGDTECVRCAGDGVCETYNQGLSCNDGAGICQGEWCDPAPPPTCEPNCDCSIPENDGLECNGGGGPVCGCGFCVIPLEDCLCGCDGDPECVECEGGQCVNINQGVACNGGAGVCIGPYCDVCLGIGGACGVDGQCCSGLCDQGACVNCKQPGGTCDAAADCCSFICSGSLCLAP